MSHWLTQIACGHTRGVIVGKSESRSTMEKPEFELGGERKRAWLRRRVNATNEAVTYYHQTRMQTQTSTIGVPSRPCVDRAVVNVVLAAETSRSRDDSWNSTVRNNAPTRHARKSLQIAPRLNSNRATNAGLGLRQCRMYLCSYVRAAAAANWSGQRS